MPRPFVQNYDVIYADKNYDQDIEVFESLVDAAPLIEKRVIEIGGGTGNHTVRLARKVGGLVSIETDADFAAILRQKLADRNLRNVTFFECPVENLAARGFDAAAAFFHVLNYLGPRQLTLFLDGLADRMKPEACFVADLWNGAVALLDPPRDEIRRKTVGNKEITQKIHPSLDAIRHTVTLNYEIAIVGGGEIEKFNERIDLYLWQGEELTAAFGQAGFSRVTFWDYGQFPQPAGPQSWRLWLRAFRD